jgi:galacturan 1,4-alpha-galacturonidase
MRVSQILSLALLQAAAALSSPNDVRSKKPACTPSKRPHHAISPHHPGKHVPSSPERTKTCIVESHGNGTDDSSSILEAIHECNNGGHVVFPKEQKFTIGTALDLTFLKHIDIGKRSPKIERKVPADYVSDIQGTIQFTNDTEYWQKSAFYQVFQNATTFFQLGGEDVNVYGGGTLDGNGQAWYDLYAKDIYILRPILFGTIGLKGGSIQDLKLRYSPQYYNFIANSSDVVFSNIDIAGGSVSKNPAKNTGEYFPKHTRETLADLHLFIYRRMGHVSQRQHRHPEFPHRQRRRLRLLQAQQHQHRRSKPSLQRLPRHQRR